MVNDDPTAEWGMWFVEDGTVARRYPPDFKFAWPGGMVLVSNGSGDFVEAFQQRDVRQVRRLGLGDAEKWTWI